MKTFFFGQIDRKALKFYVPESFVPGWEGGVVERLMREKNGIGIRVFKQPVRVGSGRADFIAVLVLVKK